MKPADPFSRSLPALVQEANGVVAQIGLLEPEEVASLQAAGVEPTTAAEKLLALATAGEAALRQSALLRGRLAVARLEVRDLTAAGYGWILQARRALSDAKAEETDTALTTILSAAHSALRTRNNRAPPVLADLDRIIPLLPDARRSSAFSLDEPLTDGVSTREALRAAVANAAAVSEQRRTTTRELEGVRQTLRATLTRVVPRWKEAAAQRGVRALMVQVCVARPRRALAAATEPVAETPNKGNEDAAAAPALCAQGGQDIP